MKKILTLLSITALSVSAHAAVSLTDTSSIYSESFDGLPTTTVASQFSATIGTQAAISGVAGWQGTKNAGNGTTATGLTANDGSGNSGGIYSYGTGTATERALGELASAGNIMTFGASFTNNTGSTVNSFTLSFTSEFWRSSSATNNSLLFSYGFSGGTATETNYLTDTSLTLASSLNVTGPAFVTTNGALDGNLPANQSNVSATVSGFTWTPGQTLFIRWADANETGNDAGLAVDNLTLAIPEPSTYAMIVGGLGLMLVVSRRKARLSS